MKFQIFIISLLCAVEITAAQTQDAAHRIMTPFSLVSSQKHSLRTPSGFLPANFDRLPDREKEAILHYLPLQLHRANLRPGNKPTSGAFKKSMPSNNERDFWQQTNGPYGGYIISLVVSGTNLFAGTDEGVYLSTNNGTSWVAAGLAGNEVASLAVSPNGAGGTNLFAGTWDGVWLSTNNGTSWTTSGPATDVYALAVSGTNLFAGTYGGVYLSTNNGTSWTAVNSGFTNSFVFSLAVSPNEAGGTNLFAGTGNSEVWSGGVYFSTNNGTSWAAAGLAGNDVASLAVSPNGAGGTNLFAGTENGVFLSTNNGTNWTAVDSGLTSNYVSAFAVIGTKLFAGTGDGVFLSTNNGTSWTAVDNGLADNDVSSLAIDSADGHLYAGTEGGGVFRSAKREFGGTIYGVTFNDLNGNGTRDAGEPVLQNWTIRLFKNDVQIDYALTTSTGYQFNNLDSGTYVVREQLQPGWIQTSPPLTYYTVTLGIGDTVNGKRNDFGNYQLSCQYSKGWNLLSVPVSTSNRLLDTLFPFATSRVFAYQEGYVPKDTLATGYGYWLKFPHDTTLVFVGLLNETDSIQITKGWNMIGSISLPILSTSITSIPPNLVTSNFFGYSGSYFNADTIMPGMGYWVRVYEDGQLILSSNSSASALAKNRIHIVPTSELPPPPPNESEVGKTILPREYALAQAYPNPFNPTTTIQYQLPSDSRVSLKVYNLLGQVVSTLVNQTEPAGYRQVNWNASTFASGIYFYRLEASSVANSSKTFTSVKKMVLVR